MRHVFTYTKEEISQMSQDEIDALITRRVEHDREVRKQEKLGAEILLEWKKSGKLAKHYFKVGDEVNWSAGSDVESGVVSKVTPSSVVVVIDETELLNGPNSGEPDALTFTPGGFCGHMSGTQRWAHTRGTRTTVFNFRSSTGRMKQKGTSSKGSMRSWGVLRHGQLRHYDYNF